MMRNWIMPGVLLFVIAFALVYVAGARGAYQDSRLNAVATAVAGHPVTASCAQSTPEWASFLATSFPGTPSFDADGFTFVDQQPVIWLAPRICDTLEALLNPSTHNEVGAYWASLSIKVILHESTHQAGVTDEGITDCTALSLLKQYAVSSFGYPAMVSVTSLKAKTVLVRVNKVTRRVLTHVLVTKTVPNPALDDLYALALSWHRALPPSYQGTC